MMDDSNDNKEGNDHEIVTEFGERWMTHIIAIKV